jgi:hypothetical protein
MKTATSFSAACALCCFLFSATLAWGQDTNFVRKNTWYFDNFGKPATSIPWSLFRETFIGIPPKYADASPFDQLIFTEVYQKSLFPAGHCFGLDLMAAQLLRYGGYDGFCAPAPQYPGAIYSAPQGVEDETIGPDDLRLEHAIQIQHGHQLNFRFLSQILDLIAQNKNRDGNYAYAQYKYYEAKKEPMVLSVTKHFSPDSGGHVLIPYHIAEEGGIKKIFVYDVNRTFFKAGTDGHDWYTNRNNYITVKPGDGTWSYDMGSSGIWSGSPSGGFSGSGSGNLIIIPFSTVRSKDRLPQSLFADAAEAIGKIFILSHDAQVEQFSTPDGRRYLKSGVQELETSDSVALRSVLPFISLNGGQPDKDAAQLYFVRGESALDLALKGGSTGYSAQFFSDYTSIKVESSEPGAIEQICVRGWHSPLPTVEIRRADGQPPTGKVEITQLVSPEGQ